MFLVFLSLVAVAVAGPQYFHQTIDPDYGYHQYYPYPAIGFDAKKFNSDLKKSMDLLRQNMDELHKTIQKHAAKTEIKDNQCEVTVPLNGFEEKDIEVKIQNNCLVVNAIHGVTNNHYVNIGLPDNINPIGRWTYADGVLKVRFRLKGDVQQEITGSENEGTQHVVEQAPADGVNVGRVFVQV